jgi:DNA-binding NarL/FixJ family response regulator
MFHHKIDVLEDKSLAEPRMDPGRHDFSGFAEKAHAAGAMLTVATDLLALTLIKELCELEPAPAVLVLTANDESFYAERVLRAGALGYVMKREATGKVVDALRHVLDGKIYASPPILIRLAEKFITAPNALETSPIASLTDRELEIFELMGRGYETDRIAAELQLSAKTVQFYYVRIREKFGFPNFTALICEAARWRAQNHKP